MQITSGHGLDALGTTPATRLGGSGGTTLIAPASAAVQVATTRSSTLLSARPAFLSIPLGSLGTVAIRGKAYEGWWNHMSRLLPARPHDSLRRLPSSQSSDDVGELSRARGSQMTSHTSIIGHGRRKRGGFRWEQYGAPLDAFSRLACQSELELALALGVRG